MIIIANVISIAGCPYACHEYANCVQVEQNRFECRCSNGYYGNGVTQCEVYSGCTENSCPANAECRNIGYSHKCSCAYVIKSTKCLQTKFD